MEDEEAARAALSEESEETSEDGDEEEEETQRPEDGKLAEEFEAAREFRLHQRKIQLREEEEGGKRKRIEDSAEVSAEVKRVKVEEPARKEETAVSTGLRDEDVRQYIQSVGGKVALKALARVTVPLLSSGLTFVSTLSQGLKRWAMLGRPVSSRLLPVLPLTRSTPTTRKCSR